MPPCLVIDLILALILLAPAGRVVAADANRSLADEIQGLPVERLTGQHPKSDWLIDPAPFKTRVVRSADGKEVVLTNGLIRRAWRLEPNGACVAFDNLVNGQSMLRGVKPEALITLDGKPQTIGGLVGQPDYAYLKPEWLNSMTADPAAWRCSAFEFSAIRAPFEWKHRRYSADLPWPPHGIELGLHFRSPSFDGIEIVVKYEMYDGIPLLSKQLIVSTTNGRSVHVDRCTVENLAVVERESIVDNPGSWSHPDLYVESDYAFVAALPFGSNSIAKWGPDPQYETQVNYERKTPCLLTVEPPYGPDVDVTPKSMFTSFRVFELAQDSEERERKSLALRRMYRTIAPWVTENPILMHVTNSSPKAVKLAIDQCAEVGFEMVIMSFGSGFDIENEKPSYIARIKEMVDYAHSKGVELGGYSLLASRRIDDADDVINPATGKTGGAIFGNSPCLGSNWGREYFRKVYAFIEQTGLDLLEHDGSYPGDPCASTTHPGHHGLQDSQWTQWRTITDFYHWCRARGVYLNVPDWYYLNGSNKDGMGYRETNWSLPRDRQIVLGRQNIYDGTWLKTPSMGWMFTPLVEYQGGGPAATLEPLRAHLDAYGAHLAQNFASGVQSCYRGPRLFDSPETKAVVKRWVDFYKAHRAILDSDVIHLRRPDGRDWDGLLHVNPSLPTKGLAVLYNPLDTPIKRSISLPLYYTGLTTTASISVNGASPKPAKLDRNYNATVTVTIPANSLTWLVVK